MKIIWTDYMKYRMQLRGFDVDKIEEIKRHSVERYFDIETHRLVMVGRHDGKLVLIPYERQGDEVTPVTIHATNRQQINFRIRAGRYRNE